ncbi:MAG: response regulator [Endozoicomonas sp.]
MTDHQGREAIGLHILVAEDNPVNQMVVAKLLEKLGCSCAIAANGLECIERLSRDRYDLVLMDCMMPELDGLEATRRIRASHSHCAEIPIIAFSANAIESDHQACLAAGMNECVDKPVTMERMRELLEKWRVKLMSSHS